MCGIVGVVRRRARRADPDPSALVRTLDDALGVLVGPGPVADRLTRAAELLEEVDRALRGAPGVRTLLAAPDAATELDHRAEGCWQHLDAIERDLDSGLVPAGESLESVNSALIRARDAAWAVRRERLPTAAAVADLGPTSRTSVDAYLSLQVALAALDRLEVRGRDSAGLHVLVRDHGIDLHDDAVAAELATTIDRPALRVRLRTCHRGRAVVRLQGGRRDR